MKGKPNLVRTGLIAILIIVGLTVSVTGSAIASPDTPVTDTPTTDAPQTNTTTLAESADTKPSDSVVKSSASSVGGDATDSDTETSTSLVEASAGDSRCVFVLGTHCYAVGVGVAAGTSGANAGVVTAVVTYPAETVGPNNPVNQVGVQTLNDADVGTASDINSNTCVVIDTSTSYPDASQCVSVS